MKHAKVLVIALYDFVKKFRIFLLEDTGLKFIVCDSLSFLIRLLSLSIDRIWMLNDHVKPDVFFNLFDNVGIGKCWDAFNGIISIGEGFEKAYDTFRDSRLLSPFMDVNWFGVEEEDFCVCELLFLRFLGLWLQCGVNREDWAYLEFAEDCLHYFN